jgi:hypothetical protein
MKVLYGKVIDKVISKMKLEDRNWKTEVGRRRNDNFSFSFSNFCLPISTFLIGNDKKYRHHKVSIKPLFERKISRHY